MAKGQFSDYHFVGGFGLGDRCENYHVPALGLKPFGCEKGDCVSYKADMSGFENPVLTVRYRSATDGDAQFMLNGKAVTFPHSNDLAFVSFEIGKADEIEFSSLGTAGIELDVLVITENGEQCSVSASLEKHGFTPEMESEKCGRGLRCKLYYPEAKQTFYILTNNEKQERELLIQAALRTLFRTDFQTATILMTNLDAHSPKAFPKRRAMRDFPQCACKINIHRPEFNTHGVYGCFRKTV